MAKSADEKIQAEIQRRVFDEEQRKREQLGARADQDALADVTSLSSEEVARIANEVRADMARKQAATRKIMLGTAVVVAAIIMIGVVSFITQYNRMVSLEEQVQTKWSQVENVYQRRYDLIPNLVETVKAYAEHEQELVQMITEARAKAGGALQMPDQILNDPKAFREFQAAQAELSHVLGRVMAVAEDNPAIKADQNFLALQAQLEGSENRIAVERKRFNEAVQSYNSYIKRFPQALTAGLAGFEKKAYFQAQEGAMDAPDVDFNENAPAVNMQN